MWVTIAILSSIIFGIASVIMKSASLKKCSDHYVLWGLYLTGSLVFFITSYGSLSFNINFSIILASIFIAIGSYFGNWFFIKALEVGPASLTASMLNINLPIIILMSVIIYSEELGYIKLAIIFLLFIAVLLVKLDPNEKMVIKDRKWFIWVILSSSFLFLREGGLKITLEFGFNNQIILLYSYIICLFLSTLSIINKEYKGLIKDNNKQEVFKKLKDAKIYLTKNNINGIYFGLVTGICSGVGLFLYSEALIIGPTSLVALIFSARSMVIVVMSYLLHKERLSMFQKCSVLFLCIGLSLASFIK
ncbi:DMT family transporter [Fluviispira multicolorata]|uniref:EamA family transporter n=1 Tax=Fluviispira multicolorata TaxID=2654512 RepID=A0A833JHJ9_9BACT|nr:DMT family transporter [Fluviispira multicolorata]KAB8033553.1 EamA family transporter [Fluviispira multicolorata]